MSDLDYLIADLQQTYDRAAVITDAVLKDPDSLFAANDVDVADWVGSTWGDLIDDLLETSANDVVAAYLAY